MLPTKSFASSSTKSSPGDGFTESEMALHTPSSVWTPALDYSEVSIGSLEAGPGNVTFMGRIGNFYNMSMPSKRPSAAQGCVKIMLTDDSGAMTVRLWYSKENWGTRLKLGMLVTVWTVHVSLGNTEASLAPSAAPLFVSIFPERERNCYFMVHEKGDDGKIFKKPFAVRDSVPLGGLMTLKNFIEGGHEVNGCKLLACVKGIGAPRKSISKDGTVSHFVPITVFDDTAEATLILYDPIANTASLWIPSHTILLLVSPRYRPDHTAKLCLTSNTQIHIDPDIADARYVRALAKRLTQKDHVNPPYPVDLFDEETAETATQRVLFKLGEIDEFARANPKDKCMGFISVLITEAHIVINYKRNMLMSTECCGMPIFANASEADCTQCGKKRTLRINPRILGNIMDETGQIASGKLILSDRAWEQLLGRTAHQLVTSPLHVIEYLEHRLLFLRFSMGFGFHLGDDEVGRLVIWCVRM